MLQLRTSMLMQLRTSMLKSSMLLRTSRRAMSTLKIPIYQLDAFAAKLAKDTLDYAWNMMWAFSVDDDANAAGEWVHAGFDEVGTLQGDTVEKAVIEEWYLVQDDKVQYYSNSKRLKQ